MIFKVLSLQDNVEIRLSHLLDTVLSGDKKKAFKHIVDLHNLCSKQELPGSPSARFLTFVYKFTQPSIRKFTISGLVQIKEKNGQQHRFEISTHKELLLQRKTEINHAINRLFIRRDWIVSLLEQNKDIPKSIQIKINKYRFNSIMSCRQEMSTSAKVDRHKSG